MSTKILLTDGSGVVKGSVFYDSAADEIRIASHDSNSPSHIDGYIAVSSAGLTSSNIALSTGAITSGTWTPTATIVSNLDSVTPLSGWYMRVGSVVSGGLRCGFDPTSSGDVRFTLTLPVASDFATSANAAGTAASGSTLQGVVFANSTDDELDIIHGNAGTSAVTTWIHFTYQVIA